MRNNTIKICSNHQDFKVPLIWTFAFPGVEWWCPYCGYQCGMFGAGIDVEETPLLIERGKAYDKFSKSFRRAMGLLYAVETKFKGQWIKPKDLPKRSQQRWARIRKNWEYGIKLEPEKQSR